MIINICPFSYLAEFMGLQAVDLMVSEKIFLKLFPHFKSIEAYDSRLV